jgi:hypothetical protein
MRCCHHAPLHSGSAAGAQLALGAAAQLLHTCATQHSVLARHVDETVSKTQVADMRPAVSCRAMTHCQANHMTCAHAVQSRQVTNIVDQHH